MNKHTEPGPAVNLVDESGRRVIIIDSRWDGDTLMVAPRSVGGGYISVADGIKHLGWYPNDDQTAEIVFNTEKLQHSKDETQ